MKDGAETRTKLSLDFAKILAREGAGSSPSWDSRSCVHLGKVESDLTHTMQRSRVDPPSLRHRPLESCQYHPGAVGSTAGCTRWMFTSSQGCKWETGMGLLPDLTQGPTASPAQTLSKPHTHREKQHHPQVPVPQNSAAIKAKFPAPWQKPSAPAGIWGQQGEQSRKNTQLPP